MESYRDLTRAVAKRQPEMLEMIAELVGLESPTEDRAGVNRCVAPGGAVDQSQRGQEPAQQTKDRRGPVGRPLRAGPEHGETVDAAGPPGHGLAAGHAEEDAFPGAPGAGVGSGCAGHEGGRGDGPGRPAHVAGGGAADPAGVVFAQQRRGDRERMFASAHRVAGEEMRGGLCSGARAGYPWGVQDGQKGRGQLPLRVHGVAAHSGVDFAGDTARCWNLAARSSAPAALPIRPGGSRSMPG